jgi:hypothetical protein
MIDQQLARLRTHRSNIQRYRNLLQTSLTELERKFVEQRLTEEQSNLESLTNSPSQCRYSPSCLSERHPAVRNPKPWA